MKKLTTTAIVALLFFAVSLAGLIWTLRGGGADGGKAVMYWFGGIGLLIGVLSKLFGGGWFTDNAGNH
jgi:hypothetical protein